MTHQLHAGFHGCFALLPAWIARRAVFAAALLVICSAGPASGQACRQLEIGFIDAPPPANNVDYDFGQAIDMDGDWAIVNAPWADIVAPNAGAAFILHRQDGVWSIVQTLLPDNGMELGSSVAISGDVIVIVQRFWPRKALVYRLVGKEWVFEQQLESPTIPGGGQFGAAVDVQGNTMVVSDDRLGTTTQQPIHYGGAHVYEFDGKTWTFQQTLLPPPEMQWYRLGYSVSLDGDVVVLGQERGLAVIPDAVHVFRRNGKGWSHEQRLAPADGIVTGKFGSVTEVLGDRLVVGRPGSSSLSSAGEVHAYGFDGTDWNLTQIMTPHDVQYCCQLFGSSLAMHGDKLVVGSPHLSVDYPTSAIPAGWVGGASLYVRQGASWIVDRDLRERWVTPSYPDVEPSVKWHEMGTAVAFDDISILVGGPMSQDNPSGFNRRGRVLYFDADGDHDYNGINDACDVDCNHNLIADGVDLLDGAEQDCNGDGQPDACEEGLEYVIENGIGQTVWGSGWSSGFDYLWLNTMRVKPGGQRITHVAAAWTSFVPYLHPGVALVYSDPNQDGSPSDAQLLSQAPIVGHNDFGFDNPLTFTTYPVPMVDVGEPGETFFVGFKMSLPPGTVVASATGPANGEHGWTFAATLGTMDLENPGSFTVKPTFAVRAAGLDCNGNGIPDSCDITTGTSLDINGNGIADECEPTCPADIAPGGPSKGDGTVGVEDLLAVVNDWGPCSGPCPGDVTFNDIVNVQDLLAVIGAWGACP